MDKKLSRLKRFQAIQKAPNQILPVELDRIDNELETLKSNDEQIAQSITILDKNINEVIIDLTDKISKVKTIKGDRGDKGSDGKDYIITEEDKKQIAKSITVPIVEKVIERTEVIKEVPIVTENVVETIKEDVSGETIIQRINDNENDKIKVEKIEGIKDYDDEIATLQNRTQLLAQISTQNKRDTLQSVTDNGATTTNKITVPAVQFDTTPVTLANAEGLLQWNATDGTLNLGMSGGDVTMQIGQEIFAKVRNEAGYETISNGQPVYISSRTGVFPDVRKARSDSETTSSILGVATQDIASPAYGFVTTYGYVRGIKTDYSGAGNWGTTWNLNDKLYVSKTVAGQLTNVEPSAPHHSDIVATVAVVGGAGTGSLFVNINKHKTLEELTDVNGTALTTSGQIPNWNETAGYFDFDKNINDYKDYAGFENRTDSTVTIDENTGRFSLTPVSVITGFNVYTNGTGKHNLKATQYVDITDDQTLTYIYIDNTGTLQKSTTIWDLTSGDNIPCAIVFMDGSNFALTDERHSYERNKNWHRWAHYNIGAMYKSGLTGTFGNNSISVTQGVIYDEDLDHDTGATKTSTSLWYRNSTSGMRLIRYNAGAKGVVSGALAYDDGSGLLQEVTANRYVTNWVYATGDAAEPIYTVIGQNNSTTLASARNATLPTINLSTAEWKLLYRVIYQRTAGVPTGVYTEAADFRTVTTGTPTSATTTDHASLTGRDAANSHPISAIDIGGTSSQFVKGDGSLQNAGLSATYNFDGTTAGTIATMTFTNGLLTAVTTR